MHRKDNKEIENIILVWEYNVLMELDCIDEGPLNDVEDIKLYVNYKQFNVI